MIQCENCGQTNTATSNFCRFCGTKFSPSKFSNGGNYEFEPPRPYVWKTDELQISKSNLRKPQQTINRVQPLNGNFNIPNPNSQPPAYRQPQNIGYAYRCPRCASQQVPRYERKISTAGWIVFGILMVAFFPLFWIGLLLKEDVPFCPVCNLKLN